MESMRNVHGGRSHEGVVGLLVLPVAVVTPDGRLPAVAYPEGRSAQQHGSGAARVRLGFGKGGVPVLVRGGLVTAGTSDRTNHRKRAIASPDRIPIGPGHGDTNILIFTIRS